MNKQLVISHYNEDLSWIRELDIPVSIYSYTLDEFGDFPVTRLYKDVGVEAVPYLRYIVDNYCNLPDQVMFVHGHDTSWHHTGRLVDIINNLDWSYPYYNINVNPIHPFYKDDIETIESHKYWRIGTTASYRRSYKLWIEDSWEELFGDDLELPDRLECMGSAQFYVERNLIKRHFPNFYRKILNWMLTTNIDRRLKVDGDEKIYPSQVSGRVIEALWHYIFVGDAIEDMEKYGDLVKQSVL